jgi:hypothetical protein
MRYYVKGDNTGFFGKGGLGNKLIGGAKFAAGVLDTPLAEIIAAGINPELGVGLHAVRSSGILERLKK